MSTTQRPLHAQAVQAPLNFSIQHEMVKTFIEYALILGLVVIFVTVAFVLLGPTPSATISAGSSHG